MTRSAFLQRSPLGRAWAGRSTAMVLAMVLAPACSGTIVGGENGGGNPGPGGGPGTGPGPGGTGPGPGGTGPGPGGTGPGGQPPPGTTPPAVDPMTGQMCNSTEFTPTRIWRISDEQFVTAVQDLIGLPAPEITSAGRSKAQFVDFAELFTVNAALTTQIRESADKVAAAAVADLPKLLACAPNQAQPACIDAFIDRLAARAFRRPLEAVERTELKALYGKGAVDGPAKGVELVVSAILQAPSFIYRTELGRAPAAEGKAVELTAHELASSLSFYLLNSIPDPDLARAADDGSLLMPAVLKRHVDRLLALPRVQENLTRMHVKWVGLGEGINPELAEKNPALTPALKASMENETTLFFRNILTRSGTLTDVLTSNKGYADRALATHYGVTAAPGPGGEVTYPADQRAGILTQAAILARYSLGHAVVFRGKYVRDELLCGEIPSPPNDPAIDVENMASAKLPEREQVARRLANTTCGACHRMMDPIGMAFMNYDALARFHTTENGMPIDSRGTISGTDDADGEVQNAVDLARKLAGSRSVRACIMDKMYSYSLGRMSGALDRCELLRIENHVQSQGGKVSELVAAIVYSNAFRFRTSTGGK
jgi:hypothetical protein